MPKPLLLDPPRFFRTIAATGCVAFLLLNSGCRTSSYSSMRRHSVAPSVLYGSSPAQQQPNESSVADAAATGTGIPVAGSVMPLTEDEVVAMLRQCGGKLRPNESGAIVEIDLSFCDLSDHPLHGITFFPEVAELDLTGTDIQNSGLAPLRNLSQLRSVKLKGTKITSEGLRLLSQIPTLILVDASNTAVTDEALLDAHQWVNLQYLSLNNTAVSDLGLEHLASLQNLKGLSVINTAVTEAGVLNLKKALPNCLIVAQTERKFIGARSTNSTPRLPDLPAPGSVVRGSESSQQLAQVVALAGCQPHLAVHLSKVYTTTEQWTEAAQILESAVASAPDDLEIHAALGEALARSGRAEESIAHFERCFGEADAKYRVGIIMYERTLKKCERYFDDVLRTDPSLNAAALRRERIQHELASLGHRPGERIAPVIDANMPEIIPAPSIRSISSARQLPAR